MSQTTYTAVDFTTPKRISTHAQNFHSNKKAPSPENTVENRVLLPVSRQPVAAKKAMMSKATQTHPSFSITATENESVPGQQLHSKGMTSTATQTQLQRITTTTATSATPPRQPVTANNTTLRQTLSHDCTSKAKSQPTLPQVFGITVTQPTPRPAPANKTTYSTAQTSPSKTTNSTSHLGLPSTTKCKSTPQSSGTTYKPTKTRRQDATTTATRTEPPPKPTPPLLKPLMLATKTRTSRIIIVCGGARCVEVTSEGEPVPPPTVPPPPPEPEGLRCIEVPTLGKDHWSLCSRTVPIGGAKAAARREAIRALMRPKPAPVPEEEEESELPKCVLWMLSPYKKPPRRHAGAGQVV